MYSIADLQLFVRTADTGSLTRAARELGLLPATASAALKRLEQKLDARLFERSTRSLRLTPRGEIFLDYCRGALALLAEGEALLAAGAAQVRGDLRVSAPSDLGRQRLLPWFDIFQAAHPGVRLGLQLSDQVSDLFRDAVDVAIRYGKLEDSSLLSQPLARNWRVVVAAPSYLARHGTPVHPRELADHNCLLYHRKSGLFNTWRFTVAGAPLEVRVRGDRMADDGGIARNWALAGHGIADKSWLDVQDDVKAGRLVTILDGYTGEDYPLQAVYPHRKSASPAARALVAFLREQFGRHGAADGAGPARLSS
ncbi:MAG TPA: LysR family transcriptional regulator [Noviherbaspirillum sp.]|jgi:DNA-binding transcriptional LysR family regulator|uniref:LysR family transcriptional regulator n=1 Tax=Noviherbaspirillum sp. TaxID=1926288 RepID=UPI002F94A57B